MLLHTLCKSRLGQWQTTIQMQRLQSLFFCEATKQPKKVMTLKKQAIDMYLEGLGFRSIGRGLTSVMVQSINRLNYLASNIKLDKIPIKR